MGVEIRNRDTDIHRRFSYDANGNVVAVDYSGNNGSTFSTYYYLRNVQGDIVKLIDNNGNTVVEYTYDSWGKLLSTTGNLRDTVGENQPFRYRGYVYDAETDWYYLQSRYYDPTTCRFISADVYLSTGKGVIGHNSYAYCGNNPISRVDSNGYFWLAIGVGFVAGLVGQYISDAVENIQNGETGADIFKPTSSLSDYAASGFGGAIAAIPGLNFAGTMAVGAVGNVVSEGFKGNINSIEDLGKCALQGAVANGAGYVVAKGMATLKVKQIGNMPRADRKAYLYNKIYCNSHTDVNVNLKTFANASMATNISLVEAKIAIFRADIYSTVTSTILTQL